VGTKGVFVGTRRAMPDQRLCYLSCQCEKSLKLRAEYSGARHITALDIDEKYPNCVVKLECTLNDVFLECTHCGCSVADVVYETCNIEVIRC